MLDQMRTAFVLKLKHFTRVIKPELCVVFMQVVVLSKVAELPTDAPVMPILGAATQYLGINITHCEKKWRYYVLQCCFCQRFF